MVNFGSNKKFLMARSSVSPLQPLKPLLATIKQELLFVVMRWAVIIQTVLGTLAR
jgi:hypothetical protein